MSRQPVCSNIWHHGGQTRSGQRRPEATTTTRIPTLTCKSDGTLFFLRRHEEKKVLCWIMDFLWIQGFHLLLAHASNWASSPPFLFLPLCCLSICHQNCCPPPLPPWKSPVVNKPWPRTRQSAGPAGSLSFSFWHERSVCLLPVTSHPQRNLVVSCRDTVTQELVAPQTLP